MLAAEADFPESARSVVFIFSSNAVIAAPGAPGEYAISKATVAPPANLFGIRLAPNGIAVYEVPARSDSHADNRCGSVAF